MSIFYVYLVALLLLLLVPHIVLYSRQVALSASPAGPHLKLLILLQAAIAEWVLNDVGLDGGERLSELGEAQLGVPVQVKPPHDRQQLRLEGLVAGPLEEAADGSLVYDLVVLVVDRFEGPADRETVEPFQVLLQLLQSQLEVDLFGEEDGELFLDQVVHVFVPWRLS